MIAFESAVNLTVIPDEAKPFKGRVGKQRFFHKCKTAGLPKGKKAFGKFGFSVFYR
jgi:hypothetical protein